MKKLTILLFIIIVMPAKSINASDNPPTITLNTTDQETIDKINQELLSGEIVNHSSGGQPYDTGKIPTVFTDPSTDIICDQEITYNCQFETTDLNGLIIHGYRLLGNDGNIYNHYSPTAPQYTYMEDEEQFYGYVYGYDKQDYYFDDKDKFEQFISMYTSTLTEQQINETNLYCENNEK